MEFGRPASPFNLVFESEGDPSEADLEAAANVTLRYLEDYFIVQYEFNSRTNLMATNGIVTEFNAAESQIFLAITLLFSEDSIFLPSQEDIDELIVTALRNPFVGQLKRLLESDLPPSNPLSATTKVTYSLDVP